MPGFNIAGAGQGPNSLAEIRRTHRWIFESSTHLSEPVLIVLQKASRPALNIEEPAMHHNQEQVYYAGKHTWESLSLSWYDVEQEPNVSKAMWDWMEQCLIFTGGNAASVNPPSTYKATETNLQMRDGLGAATETWAVYNGWPQNLNWGALDYTSTELQIIEIKFRFDRAVRTD